jgi:hypothetical protein
MILCKLFRGFISGFLSLFRKKIPLDERLNNLDRINQDAYLLEEPIV